MRASIFENSKEFLPLNNYKRIFGLILLASFAVSLAYFAVTFQGMRIHFFQFAVFASALIFGPAAGFATGLVAAIPSAIATHNYWILGGNAILGACVAIYARKISIPLAVVAAFLTQLPYLVATDLIFGIPLAMLQSMVLLIFAEDLVCGLFAWKAKDKLRQMLE
ncbi:Uncharacterised protein [Candidatus Gugararchaeum adminiculabundum]|nr:Uncharacterised protein [Candidatus Gugararchaeum adminiculabundum]